MRLPKRILTVAAAMAALSSVASGYYHFVYFPGRVAPFAPINLHFDLTKLTGNTVYFFINDQGPTTMVAGDTFTAVISELQLAAQSWNNIPSSEIKIAYGGLENVSTLQTTPGIDVVFSSEIPAGILAQTFVTTYSNVSFINNGTPFLPILRSQIQLQTNETISIPQQASFYDSTFTTMAHEFGHSLGLQHTLTSACMSTYTTRSTTKAAPIAADDIAGVSLLYPVSGYLATTGSIAGQVTLNGSGVNLASVVAVSPTTGAAISNLTNPDGTYEIDGIPPGNYLVYVHPLPPAQTGEFGPAAIVLPLDSHQNSFPANTGFVSQFFPGTRDWTQASLVGVNATTITPLVNFNVQGSAGPAVYAMELYGFLNNAIEASPMLVANGSYSLEFTAPGTLVNKTQLAPGLSLSILGSGAPASVVAGYTQYYTEGYISFGIYTSTVQQTTPATLVLTTNSDMYVLPAAFYVVPSGPPALASMSPGVDASGNGTLTVSGSGLSPATTFVFDGTVAARTVNGDGSFTLEVPAAPGNYVSSVEALNPDGQTSGQANPSGPPLSPYYYAYANPATISVSTLAGTNQVTAGADMMVQIQGNNTNFNSQTIVGFGTSDIVVKQVFVQSPTLLWVNISVNSAAALGAVTNVTVTTGLQVATFAPDLGTGLGMQIVAANPGAITLRAPILNAQTGLAGVPAGGTAIISSPNSQTNIPQNLTGWVLTIGGQQVPYWGYSNGQLQATVPGGLAPGYVQAQVVGPGGVMSPPIAMKIDEAPPVIQSVTGATGALLSSTSVVHPGDVLTVNMIGLNFDGFTPLAASSMFASLGGITGPGTIPVPVIQLNTSGSVQIEIPMSAPTGTGIPLYVGIGTRVSIVPFSLNIQ